MNKEDEYNRLILEKEIKRYPMAQQESLHQQEEFKGYGRNKTPEKQNEFLQMMRVGGSDMATSYLSQLQYTAKDKRISQFNFLTVLQSNIPSLQSYEIVSKFDEEELIHLSADIIYYSLQELWNKGENLSPKERRTQTFIESVKQTEATFYDVATKLLDQKDNFINKHRELKKAAEKSPRKNKKSTSSDIVF